MSDVMDELQQEFLSARLEIIHARYAVIARDCDHNRDALERAHEEMDAVLDMANGGRDCE
jgi:hypothetical protein